MEIFADTANLDELKEVISWGIVDGCTTNPKILSKEKGVNFEEHMKKVLKLVAGPVSIEVTTNEYEGMVKEAEEYATWGKNAVIKLPMNENGLKAAAYLEKKGIHVNVTACMSVNQAILAAKTGATYVSLFLSRIGDMGYDGVDVIRKTVEIFDKQKFKSKIIVGSIRHLIQINRSAEVGAHVLTIPYPFLKLMVQNPMTDKSIDEFLSFWDEFKKTEKK